MAPLRWGFRLLNPVAPAHAGRAAFRLFRTTQRFETPGREQDWIASAERFWIRSDEGWLSGWSWGSGPTVLLMHGWNGRASQMGAMGTALAESGYRAVAVDAPGHGDSGGRLSSLPQFADAVRLAAARFGPLHGVIAHSFGAAGTGWALRDGLDVGRIVFVAAPGDLHGYVKGFGELFGLSDRSFGAMLSRLEQRFDVPWSECRHATTVAADRTPLLVVHDRGDSETHYAGALEIHAAWPESRIVTTTGLGHRRILRDRGVIDGIAEFLDEGDGVADEPYQIDQLFAAAGGCSGFGQFAT